MTTKPANELDLGRKSSLEKDDWIELYLSEFPPEERRDVDQLKDWLKSGQVLLHETRDESGSLQTWSMSQDYNSNYEQEPSFWLGCWTVTRRSAQSSGLGRKHLPKVIEALKNEKPGYIGRFTEIESTDGRAKDSQQVRRARFYNALGMKELNVPYVMPLYQPVGSTEYVPQEQLGNAIPGQLLFATFDENRKISGAEARSIIRRIYRVGYSVSQTDPFLETRLNLIDLESENLLIPIRIKPIE